LGISVLCRAYIFTNDEKYISAAKNAIIPFQYDVMDGGLVNYFQDIVIFEEYPSKKVNAVLHGFVFALLGIYDLSLITQSSKKYKLFESGVLSVKELLKYFDLGYWSQYNLYQYSVEFPAFYKYHILHSEQLKVWYYLTQDRGFFLYGKKWKAFSNNLRTKNKVLIKKALLSITHTEQVKTCFRSLKK
jgi:hypothetical protein